jgi:hypothetical protein
MCAVLMREGCNGALPKTPGCAPLLRSCNELRRCNERRDVVTERRPHDEYLTPSHTTLLREARQVRGGRAYPSRLRLRTIARCRSSSRNR